MKHISVTLLTQSKLKAVESAITFKSYNEAPFFPNTELIDIHCNDNKHKAPLEHLYLSYHIDGISRALLKTLHSQRQAVITEKTLRQIMLELKAEPELTDTQMVKYLAQTENDIVDKMNFSALKQIHYLLTQGMPKELAYATALEWIRTTCILTINGRAIQNLFKLKSAQLPLKYLISEMKSATPDDILELLK